MQEFIWKYLVGPIVADAKGVEALTWAGATTQSGYNLFNTAVYALTALIVLHLTYRLFDHGDIEFTSTTALHTIPFVLLGGTLRFLEDAQAVPYPYNIVLITPFVYMLVAAVFILLIGFFEEKKVSIIGTVIFVPTLLYALIQFSQIRLEFLALTGLTFGAAVALYYYFAPEKYLKKPLFVLVVSQLFEGSASSAGAYLYDYTPKQLLTRSLESLFGPSGILGMKVAIAAIAVKIVSDIENSSVKALSLVVLYSIGLGTGFRMFLRALAGV